MIVVGSIWTPRHWCLFIPQKGPHTSESIIPSRLLHTFSLVHSSRLFQQAVDLILIFQLEHFGRRFLIDFFTIQQESQASHLHSLALSIRFKDLLHLRRLFDFEKGLFTRLKTSTAAAMTEAGVSDRQQRTANIDSWSLPFVSPASSVIQTLLSVL